MLAEAGIVVDVEAGSDGALIVHLYQQWRQSIELLSIAMHEDLVRVS